MSQSRRQMLLLGLLVVAFVYLAGRQLIPSLRSAGAAIGRLASGDVASDVAVESQVVAELRLADLEHKPANYKPGRNPFTFAPRQKPAPKPPPEPVAPPPRPVPAADSEPRPPSPPKPVPPPVLFAYLGSFGQPGREIAVFSEGEELFNAFEGDVLQKEFVVRRIGFESADVGFVNFPDAPPTRLAIGG